MKILLALFGAVLLCAAHAAVDVCEREFEDSPILFMPPEDGFEASKPCCLPQQLQGGIWLMKVIKSNRWPKDDIGVGFSQAMPKPFRKPIIVHGFANFSVDYHRGRLAVNAAGVTSDKKNWYNVTIVKASDLKLQFIVDWKERKCSIRPFGRLDQCISPNATFLGQPTFGVKRSFYSELKTNVYGLNFSTPEGCGRVIATVSYYSCAPVTVMSEFRSRFLTTHSSLIYHDQTTIITNPNIFNLPSFCARSEELSDEIDDEQLPHVIKYFAQDQ